MKRFYTLLFLALAGKLHQLLRNTQQYLFVLLQKKVLFKKEGIKSGCKIAYFQ